MSRPAAIFEQIYANVPAEQVDRLQEFRRSHPRKRLAYGGAQWEYIACGRGEQTLLLLPGALSVGESIFPLITAFQNEYRIIAPSYALSRTMTGLCEGIDNILAAEGVNRAHVIGGSYGGLVAQYFVRMFPERTCSLVLLHTFLVTPKLELPLKLTGWLLPMLPSTLLVPLLKLRLNKLLLSTLRRRKHPEYEF